MAKHTFVIDENWVGQASVWHTGIEGQNDCGYRTITVNGNFGGGVIRLGTLNEGVLTYFPNFEMYQDDVDELATSLLQRNFSCSGEIVVRLEAVIGEPNLIVTVT